MPRTMGGMDHTGGDARATGEGSSGWQGRLDVLATVLDLHLEEVAPSPVQVNLLPRLLTPPTDHVVDDDDEGEEVLRSQQVAHQPEQVAPLPQAVRLLPLDPLVPEPVVAVDVDEDILSKDVDSDEEGQMIYRTRNGRELVGGVHVRRVSPIAGGYG
ncbi:uncharacterized protein [Triticum aestivum]|uniref:uncharacterized protein n=1 Tax=Triticum aestivum TaxID=4565 RepID=UPI001D024352|nr:uncharacterized protein LOC123081981 [Triticum aestivum]